MTDAPRVNSARDFPLVLVVPASGSQAELELTLRSLADACAGGLVEVIVPHPAADLEVPGIVGRCLADAVCVPVAGPTTWGRLANAAAGHVEPGMWVGWMVAGMSCAPDLCERIADRITVMPGADHTVAGTLLWGSAMEILVAQAPAQPWPELGLDGVDPWKLVGALAQLLEPVPTAPEDERAQPEPAHATGFRHDLDALREAITVAVPAGRRTRHREPAPWESTFVQRGLTSIVILTCNQLEYTRQCLESLRRHTPQAHEIIVVDNGSTDGTQAFLRDQDDVLLIENTANHGFSGGCNQGLAVARGDSVLFLNNDTVVTDGWLAPMLDAIADGSAGVAGPRSNRVVGEQLVADVSYNEETLDGLDEFAHAFRDIQAPSVTSPIRLIGFCLLMRREVLERIGGFDVRYGIGNLEDDDICLRARVAGYELAMCNDSFVHHFGGRTFDGEGIDYTDTSQRNWTSFIRKWEFPEGAVDWAGMRYNPSAVCERPFDPAAHWSSPWPTAQRPMAVEFESRSAAVYVPSEWAAADELADVFAAAITALGPTDDVTLVVRAGDQDDGTLRALEHAAADIPDSELPDVVIIPAELDALAAIWQRCTHALAFGRAASTIASVAWHTGTKPILVEQLSNCAEEATWRAA